MGHSGWCFQETGLARVDGVKQKKQGWEEHERKSDGRGLKC